MVEKFFFNVIHTTTFIKALLHLTNFDHNNINICKTSFEISLAGKIKLLLLAWWIIEVPPDFFMIVIFNSFLKIRGHQCF